MSLAPTSVVSPHPVHFPVCLRLQRGTAAANRGLRNRRGWLQVGFAALAFAAGAGKSAAATFVWDGGAGAPFNWSAANNWNPNGAPAPGVSHDYQFGGGTGTTNVADGATPWTVNSLTLLNTATASFSISSSTSLNLGAGGVVNTNLP